jgi:hypothetical protein
MPGRLEKENVKYVLSSLVIVALLLGNSYDARAQTEITLLAPGPIRGPLDKLIASFESNIDSLFFRGL